MAQVRKTSIAAVRKSAISAFAGAASLLLTGWASAANINDSAAGIAAGLDRTNWGLTASVLNGIVSGVNWTHGGINQNNDWTFSSGGGQSGGSDGNTQWFANTSTSSVTQTSSTGTVAGVTLGIGPTMKADVQAAGGSFLFISELTPGAGTFSLNGVTQSSTGNQVLQWTLPVNDSTFVNGNSMVFTSTGSNTGPIGFSIPEPASFSLLGAGAMAFLVRRRR